MDNKRIRLKYIDAIRFLAVIFVVIGHFNEAMVQNEITIYGHSYTIPGVFHNISLSSGLGVSLFFIISGFSLFYNYHDDFKLKNYLRKRFMSIYPTFWCSYLLCFLVLFLYHREFWFETKEQIPNIRFALSVIGMDGYFLYLGKNFYLIGEWFLGCIIIFYLIFPLLRKCVMKHPFITFGIATLVYILVVIYNPFKVSITRNLLVRGYDFLFGMLLSKLLQEKKINTGIGYLFICSVIVLCISFALPPVKYSIIVITMAGWSLFLILTCLFYNIDVGKVYFVKIVNRYSYEIFLLHHICMSFCLNYFRKHQYSLPEGIVLIIMYILALVLFIMLQIKVKKKIADIISDLKNCLIRC